MKIEWTSKIGNEAKPFRVGLTSGGALVTFASLTGPGGTGAPQLRLRYRNTGDVLSFDLAAYADPETPAQFNAQRFFTADDFTAIAAVGTGIWIAEVDAELAGLDITFPDDRHPLIRFLPSAN